MKVVKGKGGFTPVVLTLESPVEIAIVVCALYAADRDQMIEEARGLCPEHVDAIKDVLENSPIGQTPDIAIAAALEKVSCLRS